MRKKVYMKEGVGFEGITMMQKGKSGAPKILRFAALLLIVLGLIGFAVAGLMQTKKQPLPQAPNVVFLPTSARNLDDALTSEPVAVDTVSPTEAVSSSPTRRLSPTVAPTVKVSPTVGSVKKPIITVAVLNGSGTKGAAREMSSALTNAGYTVSKTGNADSFTYTDITVQIKKSKQQFLDQLKKDLSANNYLVTKSTADLPETESTDVIIIVGTSQ